LFHWKRQVSGAGFAHGHYSHRPSSVIYKGGWTHPQHIDGGVCKAIYNNYGTNGNSFYDSYDTPVGDAFKIAAYSEWSLGNSEKILNLDNLNPFRYYRNYNSANNTTASRYYNTDIDFFNASVSFKDFCLSRSRNGANNYNAFNTGNPHIGANPRQSDFNVYLAFALVIQNPENSNQYIVGPLSNVVKQSLVMGINSSNKKVPKGFAYRV
jgi:hypothetical protein